MCEICFERLLRDFPQASNDERMDILWNMTAFPASDGKFTGNQISALANKVKARKNGWRKRLTIERQRQEEEMYRILREISARGVRD